MSDGGSLVVSTTSQSQSFSERRATAEDSASQTYITSFIDDLKSSLQALGSDPDPRQLEDWATLIHECLSTESRKFHSVHHVFEISAGCDPLQLLAAFFRDTINCSADGGLTPRQAAYVEGILSRDKQYLAPTDDSVVLLIMDIFGLKQEQCICDYEGINIYLSAILMARVLPLTEHQIFKVAALLEATIPFRGPNEIGETALDILFQRVIAVNARRKLGSTEDEIVDLIQRAADLNNRTLGNFASEDAVYFLDHTWSLLPEHSKALRRSLLYTVNDMCQACDEMLRFLEGLDSSVVFQSFRGVPPDDETSFFEQRLSSNLEKGIKYIRAQLLSTAIVSAVATLTGGDAPMSFFAGDLPTHKYRSVRLGENFPTFSYQKLYNCDRDVYLILTRGRQLEQSFDTRNSPIAAFVYATLGDGGVARALHECHQFPLTPEESQQLLRRLPRSNVMMIALDIAAIAVSRAEAIEDMLGELFGEDSNAKTAGV
jgi:hypothetical protein